MHVALVGATGAVGQECLKILGQRGFPCETLTLLASARSAGKSVAFRGKPVVVQEIGERSFEGVDVSFFAADAETSKRFAPIAASAGAVAIDKSSAYRGDPSVPLVIPEVNPTALDGLRRSREAGGGSGRAGGIVAVPNCTTIVLLIALEPLRRALGIERVVVSTYQAASGAGADAMAELESQTRDVLAGKAAVPRVFKEPCAFNVFSHDSSMDPATGLNAEEAKLVSETRSIWGVPRGGRVRVSGTCVRVGVMRSHTEAVCVTLKKPASEREVRELLARGETIEVVDDRVGNKFPTPLKAAGGDTVLVGRIRPDRSQDEDPDSPTDATTRHIGWNLFISADQLRLGAALTAVKIAERVVGLR